MTPQRPELHAVVEVAIPDRRDLWVPLPPKPWPSHVRLCGTTPPDLVALLVGVASTYGDPQGEPATSSRATLEGFPVALPGGIAVVTPDKSIMPGCCCGLEGWREWRGVLADGQSPWTGHDPSPLLGIDDHEIQVWSDGGMGSKPIGETPIVFGREQFRDALNQAGRDLVDFLLPLRGWLDAHAPIEAAQMVDRFRATFVDGGDPRQTG